VLHEEKLLANEKKVVEPRRVGKRLANRAEAFLKEEG